MKKRQEFVVLIASVALAAALIGVAWLFQSKAEQQAGAVPAAPANADSGPEQYAEHFSAAWGYLRADKTISFDTTGTEELLDLYHYRTSAWDEEPEHLYKLDTDYGVVIGVRFLSGHVTRIRLNYDKQKLADVGGKDAIVRTLTDKLGQPHESKPPLLIWKFPGVDRIATWDGSDSPTFTIELLSRQEKIDAEKKTQANEAERKKKNTGL